MKKLTKGGRNCRLFDSRWFWSDDLSRPAGPRLTCLSMKNHRRVYAMAGSDDKTASGIRTLREQHQIPPPSPSRTNLKIT